jgi:hypothetical protein
MGNLNTRETVGKSLELKQKYHCDVCYRWYKSPNTWWKCRLANEMNDAWKSMMDANSSEGVRKIAKTFDTLSGDDGGGSLYFGAECDVVADELYELAIQFDSYEKPIVPKKA